MKGSKIIVVLTIIIIILIGIIYNLINTTIFKNKKLILKEMTEAEYESQIAQLNKSHEEYALQVQSNKQKIASAITDMGITTSNKETFETMASNIRSIVRGSGELIYTNTGYLCDAKIINGNFSNVNALLIEFVTEEMSSSRVYYDVCVKNGKNTILAEDASTAFNFRRRITLTDTSINIEIGYLNNWSTPHATYACPTRIWTANIDDIDI